MKPLNETLFWQFSLRHYFCDNALYAANEKDHYKNNFLRLQDEFDYNVNVVLAVLLLNSKGFALDIPALKTLMSEILPLDTKTKRLRQRRRTVSDKQDESSKSEYKQLLQEELALEKKQQNLIIRALQAMYSEYTLILKEDSEYSVDSLLSLVSFSNADASKQAQTILAYLFERIVKREQNYAP